MTSLGTGQSSGHIALLKRGRLSLGQRVSGRHPNHESSWTSQGVWAVLLVNRRSGGRRGERGRKRGGTRFPGFCLAPAHAFAKSPPWRREVAGVGAGDHRPPLTRETGKVSQGSLGSGGGSFRTEGPGLHSAAGPPLPSPAGSPCCEMLTLPSFSSKHPSTLMSTRRCAPEPCGTGPSAPSATWTFSSMSWW